MAAAAQGLCVDGGGAEAAGGGAGVVPRDVRAAARLP